MSAVATRGLHYGKIDGYQYVYGQPKTSSMAEVINAFPKSNILPSNMLRFDSVDAGSFYIIPDNESKVVPTEVLNHIRQEYFNTCYEWFEFNDSRALLSFVTIGRVPNTVKLFKDNKGKYYARCTGVSLSYISDFAYGVDLNTTFNLEFSETLTAVEWKEEKVEK